MTAQDDFRLAFRQLISGQRQGIAAAIARTALWSAQPVYAAAMAARHAYYQYLPGTCHRAGLPVVSVGNVTAGGTGKTPMVAFLARWLRQQALRVAVVSRGYRASPGTVSDESHELASILPDVLLVQNRDRVAAACQIAQEDRADVVLLDDGFQHRRLHRDVDIVLIDALEPDGFGYLLPRGLLREPLHALARADVVALTRADAVSAHQRASLRDRMLRWAPQACWVELAHRATEFVNAAGATAPLTSLTGQTIAAFCGIGNADGFRHTLRQQGLRIGYFQEFADHASFSQDDLDQFARQVACQQNVTAVICTRKDIGKIAATHLADRPLWALGIAMDATVGREDLFQLLARRIPLGAGPRQ